MREYILVFENFEILSAANLDHNNISDNRNVLPNEFMTTSGKKSPPERQIYRPSSLNYTSPCLNH